MNEQAFEQRFWEQIAHLKDHPKDNEALRSFLDELVSSGLPFNARSILEMLLPERAERHLVDYLIGFISAYSGQQREITETALSDSISENIVQLNNMTGFLAASNRPLESQRAELLARCLSSIEQSNPSDDLTELLTGQASERNQTAPENLGWVCFVVENNITIRIRKLAHAIRSAGRKVKLILRQSDFFLPPSPDDFDEITVLPARCNPFLLWDELDKTPAMAFQCFVADRHSYIEALSTLIARPNQCVVDFYDFSHPDVGPMKRFEEGSERWREFEFHARIYRFLINHASGLCCRNLFARFQRSNLESMRGHQHRICFPEFGWGQSGDSQGKLSDQDGKIHAVAASTFFTGTRYNAKFRGYPLLEHAKRLDIHLHLYAMTPTDEEYSDLERLVGGLENVHLHKPVPYEQWLQECCQYDVGLFRLYPRDNEQMENIPLAWDPSGGWSNKFGDFLDCDAYMIFGSDIKYQAFVAKRYGIGEAGDEEDLLSPTFWQKIWEDLPNKRMNFDAARRSLAINTHGPRLIRFYETFADSSVI